MFLRKHIHVASGVFRHCFETRTRGLAAEQIIIQMRSASASGEPTSVYTEVAAGPNAVMTFPQSIDTGRHIKHKRRWSSSHDLRLLYYRCIFYILYTEPPTIHKIASPRLILPRLTNDNKSRVTTQQHYYTTPVRHRFSPQKLYTLLRYLEKRTKQHHHQE